MLDTTRPEPLRSPLLDRERENGVKHGFFTRVGGVSTGLYQGLNVGYGSGDDRETVTENRRRVAEWLGVDADHLLTVHQVHSPHAVIVDELCGRPPRGRRSGDQSAGTGTGCTGG